MSVIMSTASASVKVEAGRPSAAMWRYKHSYEGFCSMIEEFPTCNASYNPDVRQPTVFSKSGCEFDWTSPHAWIYSPGGDPLQFLSEEELYKYHKEIQNNVNNGYPEGDFETDFPDIIKRAMRKRSKKAGKTKKPKTKGAASNVTTTTIKPKLPVSRANEIIENLD